MKIIIIIVCALTLVVAYFADAHADALYSQCSFGEKGYVCVTAEVGSADPRIITREPQEPNKDWLAFCKPKLVTDHLGVGRYVYAHEGCEYGRIK